MKVKKSSLIVWKKQKKKKNVKFKDYNVFLLQSEVELIIEAKRLSNIFCYLVRNSKESNIEHSDRNFSLFLNLNDCFQNSKTQTFFSNFQLFSIFLKKQRIESKSKIHWSCWIRLLNKIVIGRIRRVDVLCLCFWKERE